MKKYTMWIVELMIWAALIFSVLFVSVYLYDTNVRKNYTYYVFFHDVDGLIKGSPVKFQGYQVGYVSNISIINDEVFVTFIITERTFKMPDNLDATVAFTGMGGSKSLELTGEGSVPGGRNIITSIEPKRVQDFFTYQSRIAQNIVFMTSDFMKLFDDERLSQIKSLIRNPVFIRETDSALDYINTQVNDIQNRKNSYGNKSSKQ